MLPSSPNAKTIDKYRLVRELGDGAFVAVWAAVDTEDGTEVAVKLVHQNRLNDSEAAHVLREVRSAGQLSHPNIVSVREVGKCQDQQYIVSELINGISLKSWMKRYACDTDQAARWCAILGRALQHAHDAGIVHRDLKPANIMIDMEEELHIMDFGLAKQSSDHVTTAIERYQRARYMLRQERNGTAAQSGPLLGTPAYMPPEQARGDAYLADHRADIYSLGVILYELLSRRRPFLGKPSHVLRQIRVSEPKPPRWSNRRVPKVLQDICLMAMSKAPAARYQSAGEFADDLDAFQNGQPVKAKHRTFIGLATRLLFNRLTSPFRGR